MYALGSYSMYDGQKELGKSAEVLLLVEFGHA